MKLRNKKTGEIVNFKIVADYDDCTAGWRLEKKDGSVLFYDHIDEIYEEWEDAVGGFIITPETIFDVQGDWEGYSENDIKEAKELGLWYKTSEEAEKAAKKLKAFQRLKNIGFKFDGIDVINRTIKFKLEYGTTMACGDDLQTVFGGKEW